jgi:hypothetical protein
VTEHKEDAKRVVKDRDKKPVTKDAEEVVKVHVAMRHEAIRDMVPAIGVLRGVVVSTALSHRAEKG